MKISYRVENRIALVTINNPPVNVLNREIFQGRKIVLYDNIDNLLKDERVQKTQFFN